MKIKISILLCFVWIPISNHLVYGQSCNIDEVRIFVAYTQAVENEYPSKNVLKELIEPLIDKTNQAYANSGINHKVRLVRAKKYNYTEASKLVDSRNYFMANSGSQNSNSVFRDIPEMRTLYHADIFVLLVASGDQGGIGSGIGVQRDNAYAVVKTSLVVLSRNVLTHEIGHLYGCKHEIALDPTTGTTHGYVFPTLTDNQGKKVHTIMAYGTIANNGITTNPIPYFSDPNETYQGHLRGDANSNATAQMNAGYSTIKGLILSDHMDISQPDIIKANQMGDVHATKSLTTTPGTAYIIESGGTAYLHVDGTDPVIKLRPGFHAKNGSSMRAHICPSGDQYIPASPPNKFVITDSKSDEILKNNKGKLQIYPNPFKEFTTVAFHLEQPTEVSIELIDLNGRIVRVLEPVRQRKSGTHKINISGENLSNGIYLVRLRTNTYTETKRLVFSGR